MRYDPAGIQPYKDEFQTVNQELGNVRCTYNTIFLSGTADILKTIQCEILLLYGPGKTLSSPEGYATVNEIFATVFLQSAFSSGDKQYEL